MPDRALTQIDLGDLGRFTDTPASFAITSPDLPTGWDYIYENRQVLLRLDQHGMAYAGAFPPSDIVLFMRDRNERASVWPVWLRSSRFGAGLISNTFRPCPGEADPAARPAVFRIDFTPELARYTIEHRGVRCVTEIMVPQDAPAICQRVTITNLGTDPLQLSAFPALRHFSQWGTMAAWDKPEWYTRTAFGRAADGTPGFSTHVTSPTCKARDRRATVLWSSPEDLIAAEVSLERFIGQGSCVHPEAPVRGGLRLDAAAAAPWGTYTDDNNLFAYPQCCALEYRLDLAPGESRAIRQVFAWLPTTAAGLLPPAAEALALARWLDPAVFDREVAGRRQQFAAVRAVRTLRSPEPALDRFASEWLPLQLQWACSLDRGWPTGMRGGRDAANDFAALAPYDPAFVREMIRTELSCQRPDGWVPRHFSARGHAGRERDTRQPTDAGAVVLEMVHAYLCQTRDWVLLDQPLPWLDRPADETATVLEHVLRIVAYYREPQNLGEHGLCKLREGGWLDSLNQAGLRGRGEDVMLTCQVVYGLALVDEILAGAAAAGMRLAGADRAGFTAFAAALTGAVRQQAFNAGGWFSGFFNDEGRWLFSERDPDGEARLYGPANYWAVISGVARADLEPAALAVAERLRCPDGFLLHHPGFSHDFFTCGGRMTSGDSPDGRSEHHNPYNHGSHGFLARAAAVAGRGDLLLESLVALLPYDQERHPVGTSLRAPYAVVNVWEDIPGFRRRAKDTFLTGSTAYGVRIVFEWMLGIRPTWDGLIIDPCLPPPWPGAEVEFIHLGRRATLRVSNRSGRGVGVVDLRVDGRVVERSRTDPTSRRTVRIIDDAGWSVASAPVVIEAWV